MKTVGKQLQDARLEKGWSPELAARETKIRVDRLHELESDDYSNFSSPTYARGFVRTYARALGMDEYKILRQLDNKLPEDDNASFANDTGVPYMPESSKVARPFEVGRGVYIAAAVGTAFLLLIGFILVQVYRAGYFAQALPATAALPATNALPVTPDTETAQRALPADSSAPLVALPVDTSSAVTTTPAAPPATAPPPPAAPVDTNAPLRALPVDPAALVTATNEAPAVSTATPNATPGSPVSPSTATTPIDTSTPPRALPVDPNTAYSAPNVQATPASGSITGTAYTPPVENPAPSPAPAVQPQPAPSISARQSDARPHAPKVVSNDSPATGQPNVPTDAAPPSDPIVATTTPEPGSTALTDPAIAPNSATQPAATEAPSAPSADDSAPAPSNSPSAPRALPVVLPSPETESAPSTPSPSTTTPDSASALTGGDSVAPGDATTSPQTQANTRGKRLVLTASQDSFVRVVALDGVHGDHVRYSSMLHSGQSISFSDRKYSINVGDPAVVDISLDGINYGPHSDHSEPDTFTVESRQP
jgi:cytoskeletal protein RodZ